LKTKLIFQSLDFSNLFEELKKILGDDINFSFSAREITISMKRQMTASEEKLVENLIRTHKPDFTKKIRVEEP